MSREKDFQSKEHVTKHLTLGRYGEIDEATRINSWEELDFIEWELFLDGTLTPDRITPDSLKTITEANKYGRAYKSFKFGMAQAIKSKWLIIVIGVAIAGVVLLYVTGMLGGP